MTAKVLTNIEVQGQVCVCLYGVIVFKSNVLTFHSFRYQITAFSDFSKSAAETANLGKSLNLKMNDD